MLSAVPPCLTAAAVHSFTMPSHRCHITPGLSASGNTRPLCLSFQLQILLLIQACLSSGPQRSISPAAPCEDSSILRSLSVLAGLYPPQRFSIRLTLSLSFLSQVCQIICSFLCRKRRRDFAKAFSARPLKPFRRPYERQHGLNHPCCLSTIIPFPLFKDN